MSKTFCVYGFLYNLKTQQILLIQSKPEDDIAPSWSMLGGEGNEGEDAQITFQRIVNELLDLNIKTKNIYPIYDYFHNSLERLNYIFYVEVKKRLAFDSYKEGTLAWVSFNETLKMNFADHTKQDVMVAKRVIDAKEREENNQNEISAYAA